MKIEILFKKGWKWIFSLFLPLLFSCATQQQVNSLGTRINQLETRVYSLEGEISKEKEITRNLDKKIDKNLEDLRSRIADIRADLDSVKEDLNSVRGNTEENKRIIKQLVESEFTKVDQMNQQLNQISERLSKLEEQVKQIREYVGLEEIIKKKKATQLYSNAYTLYKQGKYEAAIAGFKSFLKKYPRSSLSDNAWFWIGECYMGLKDYEKAILAYYNVIKKYPKGNKAPSSMLRLAQAFLKIGDKTSAKVILRKLIKKYPRSKEARIGRKLLKKIK